MIILIIFILTVFLGGLVLPALLGPLEFLIIPVFLLAIIIFDKDFKAGLIKGIFFGFLVEIFFGFRLGSITSSLLLVAMLYYWLERSTNIGSLFKKPIDKLSILGQSSFLAMFTYLYSFIFILNQTSYDIVLAWQRFNLLLNVFIILNTFLFSAFFSYVLAKTRQRL